MNKVNFLAWAFNMHWAIISTTTESIEESIEYVTPAGNIVEVTVDKDGEVIVKQL